ncbi:MAG TPA: carboxypeptidase-like regulatory domain-containing protein [Gemmatimonadaceae bacterium]
MKQSVLFAALAVAVPSALRAQAAVDLTVSSSIGQVMGYSSVEVTGIASRFTNETGRLVLQLDPGKTYRIRVKHLGYRAADTTITISADQRYSLKVTLNPIVVEVAATRVSGKTNCRMASDEESALGRIVGELRKNAEREALLRSSYPFVYKLVRDYEAPEGFRLKPRRDTVEYPSDIEDRYEPGNIVRYARNPVPGAARELRIPTLVDLADESFLKVHCFYYRGVTLVDGARLHKIDFEPVPGFNKADVRGSAYLDETTFVIRRAVFTIDRPQKLVPPVVGLEVTTTYREILPGLALVDFIRGVQDMPGRSREQRIEEQRLIAVHFTDRMPGQ